MTATAGFAGYDELQVRLDRGEGESYLVRAIAADGSTASGEFVLPFDSIKLENFVLRVGRARRSTRGFGSSQMEAAQDFGAKLFGALFADSVRDVYRQARERADSKGKGLRLTLCLSTVPELQHIPWEFLYDRPMFLAHSIETPVVRSLDLDTVRQPRDVSLPLRIVGVDSRPVDNIALDAEQERRNLEDALEDLLKQGKVELHWLERATLRELQRTLDGPDDFHVFHFIGHGAYHERSDIGTLFLEDVDGRTHEITGEELGPVLYDERTLRLAVLNACEGARDSPKDPFSGVAASLVASGIPAVVGMQFEITDDGAVTFAQQFYESLARGLPADAALAQARRAMWAERQDTEFGTPVLFLRARDAKLFDVDSERPPAPSAAQDDADAEIVRGQGPAAIDREVPVSPEQQTRLALAAGIEAVASAVRKTIGPAGRPVLSRSDAGVTRLDKGVVIAEGIEVTDRIEAAGVDMVVKAAQWLRAAAGDGTTSAILIANELVAGGVRAEAQGINPARLRRGMDAALTAVERELQTQATEVAGKEEVARIVSLSARDEAIGEALADAVEKVGAAGVLMVEEGQTLGMELEFTEGMQFDNGYVSPYMVTDQDRMEAVLEDPYILIANQKIGSVRDVLPVLEQIIQSGKPLLIIAVDVEGESLATLVVNKLHDTFTGVAVKAPGFGDRRKRMLEDIAILTGGEVITEEMGLKLENTQLAQLGRARRVVVSKATTAIVDGHGEPEIIKGRIYQIRDEILNADSDFEREKLQERLAKLAGGVAVLNIGAATQTEMRAGVEKAEDAIKAIRAAFEEGVLPGGGAALVRASRHLEPQKPIDPVVLEIVHRALQEPLRQIVANAGGEPDSAVEKVRESDPCQLFDAATEDWIPCQSRRILDPAGVTRMAIGAAREVATDVMGTNLVIEKPPDTPQSDGNNGESGPG